MNDEVLAGLKAKIESEFVAFELTVRRGLAHIRAIGLYLIECQEAVKAEGVGFKRWIEAEFAGKFSYPTAWNWMSVARHWDEFSEDELAQMTMKQMLKAVADRNRWPSWTPRRSRPSRNSWQSDRSGAGHHTAHGPATGG